MPLSLIKPPLTNTLRSVMRGRIMFVPVGAVSLLLCLEGVAEHYLELVDVGEGSVVKLEVII